MNTTPYLVWQKEYETGIDIVDEQHRGLFSLINTFFYHKSDASGNINRFLVPTAEMLKAYTQLHYLTLERLLRNAQYPDIEKIVEYHNEILHNIKMMDARCRADRDADGWLSFLKDYWQKRTSTPNAAYIAYLRKHS
jgi:hemerythrin-like metal-binding protein